LLFLGAFRADTRRGACVVEVCTRVIRVLLMSSTRCRNTIDCGSHQIGGIISPDRWPSTETVVGSGF